MREIWERLRTLHYTARRNDHSMEVFPSWIRRILPERQIKLAVREGFDEDLAKLTAHQKNLPGHFGAPSWHFILYFNDLSQRKLKVLRAVKNARSDLDLPSLWGEAEGHRRRRLKRTKPSNETENFVPWKFEVRDFRACR